MAKLAESMLLLREPPASEFESSGVEDFSDQARSVSEEDLIFEDENVLHTWSLLPDLLLEKVFSFLSLRDRYHASTVCKHWYDVFYSPALWRKLVMTESAFTHQRFTPHKGYWTELSHHKVQMCLKKVGAFLQTIRIEPIAEFFNLFEFLRIWNMFIEYHEPDYPMASLINFYFTFSCDCREQSDVFVYGTGGKLLEELKRLFDNLKALELLKLNNLLLELADAPGVLDCIVKNCGSSLQHLEIRNYTKDLYPLFIAGMFPNLRTLIVSPQQLNSYIVLRLAESRVTNLHIVQDHYCDESYIIERETWKQVSEKSPALSVHLSCAGQSAFEIGWQDGAPVVSVTYTSKFSRVYSVAIETITIMYNTSLRVYGHYGLPRYHGNRSFTNRCDTDLVNLVRTCSKLHTLVIRDRISTCTLILIAREGKSLRRLYVRRSGIIKRCDWQRTITWDDEYYWTMRRASHCYDATFTEVSRRLGYNWEPLSDKAFMELSPPHCEMTVSSDFDTS